MPSPSIGDSIITRLTDRFARMKVLVLLLLLLLNSFINILAYEKSKSTYVGGWSNWTYWFEPMALPNDCSVEHAHGISIDNFNNIVVTYKDAKDSSKCLLQWKAGEYNKPPNYLGPGKALCQGVPHGLTTILQQDDDDDDMNHTRVLYHANNEQALHKTSMNGSIIWSTLGASNPCGRHK